MRKIRCAVYTRKSTQEGLEQDFNSLHAQREACEAYVTSQKHEGWVILPDLYDDGGISGGTLERPALQRLLKDVDEGLVDHIIVYKIDRLTRSLADFAKLVDRLDAAEASFVSVTQSFNTATSMGRLTLNVLLSFAQFEREVTAERIKDKIAASKQKGLWMGGQVPFGYEPDGRSLKIIPKEAQTIKVLYELYLNHGTVKRAMEEAAKRDIRSKQNRLMGYGHVHHVLTNPVYAGMIRHKTHVYEGKHAAIIERNLWDRVQIQLKTNASKPRSMTTKAGNRSLLAGKLKDETGDKLVPSHANKKGRRYRYYVSFRLIRSNNLTNQGASVMDGWRLPAPEIEKQVMLSVIKHLEGMITSIQSETLGARQITGLYTTINKLKSFPGCQSTRERIVRLIDQTIIKPGKLTINLKGSHIAKLLGLDEIALSQHMLSIQEPFRMRKRGMETKLIINHSGSQSDPVLIQNIAKAHNWYERIKKGSTIEDIAEAEKVSIQRIRQLVELAFVAPDIVRMILNGQQPINLTSEWLLRHKLPVNWNAQRALISTL